MSDEGRDPSFNADFLAEDPKELARTQLAQLEKSLDDCRDAGAVATLIDEAYRAAHTLKAAVDPRTMPNVHRLARRVQEVVRAARGGSLAVTVELGGVLASIARVAREALGNGPGAEPLAASSAAATLEEILQHPAAWSAPPGLATHDFEWAKVEAGRLSAAADAARTSREAFSAYSRAAVEASAVSAKFLEGLEAHRQAVEGLREAIPRALAAAARGEATSAAAAELAEGLSDLSVLAAGLSQPLSVSSDAVEKAAVAGRRAADIAEGAFASLVCVRLDALLEFLPRLARSLSRRTGLRVELVQEPTNVEVRASRSEIVVLLVTRCVRAVVGAMSGGRPSRRRAAARPSRDTAALAVFARAAAESLHLRLALTGPAPDVRALEAALAAVRRRLKKEGASLDVEARKGEGASLLLTIRGAAVVASRSGEFVFARAGEAWYAIPASSVVECIDGDLGMPEYVLDGERLPTLRMNDTQEPRRAVVVKTTRGGAVLLFDGIGSRETGLQTPASDPPLVAGIAGSVRRADGSTARLLDLGVLLPQPG